MILSNNRQHPYLDGHVDADIQMTQAEWEMFKDITDATYRPRTMAEYNAMCDLTGARFAADYQEAQKKGDAKTMQVAMVRVINCGMARFTPDGSVNLKLLGKGNPGAPEPQQGTRPKLAIVGKPD